MTIRGASGNRDAVVIQGQGYGTASEGLMIQTSNVTIADLTLTGMRNHGVSIKGELGAEAPHIYNVHLYDIGTQHIKGTPGDGVHDGVVACSKIGYTPGGVQGDYINGIDIHGGVDWIVRDNELYNIWGDGTGCEVDVDCGTYQPGGGPAILFWNGSSGTVVERNRIVDSFRGIALGFGSAHPGGVVRNNFFFQTQDGDAGIQINGGSDIQVDHNTVILGGSYPGAVEVWNSSNLLVRNNLLSQPVWNRGSTTYTDAGNKTNGSAADLAAIGDPHLASTSAAIDFSSTVALAVDDIDGTGRPQGSRNDAGCDEWSQAPPPPDPEDDQYETSGSESHMHVEDEDWLRFMAHPNATYRIETTNLIGGADTVLELSAACGSVLASDDNGGVGLGSRIDYANPTASYMDVRIRDASGAYGSGKGYDVSVTCIANCPVCTLPGGDNYELANEVLSTDHTVEACYSVTSTGNTLVTGTANVLLRAGQSVSLGDGFGVTADGVLTVDIDPALVP